MCAKCAICDVMEVIVDEHEECHEPSEVDPGDVQCANCVILVVEARNCKDSF